MTGDALKIIVHPLTNVMTPGNNPVNRPRHLLLTFPADSWHDMDGYFHKNMDFIAALD